MHAVALTASLVETKGGGGGGLDGRYFQHFLPFPFLLLLRNVKYYIPTKYDNYSLAYYRFKKIEERHQQNNTDIVPTPL